jgi:hypothetical protein
MVIRTSLEKLSGPELFAQGAGNNRVGQGSIVDVPGVSAGSPLHPGKTPELFQHVYQMDLGILFAELLEAPHIGGAT